MKDYDKICWGLLFCGLGCIVGFAFAWVAEQVILSTIMLGTGCYFLSVVVVAELKKKGEENGSDEDRGNEKRDA